jgi:hypothetical protein
MSDTPLPVHSLAEAHLYLMITPCAACGRGLLKARNAAPDGDRLALLARCEACGREQTYRFILTEGRWPDPGGEDARRINPTAERSAIIDVAQWLTLFRVILDAADKQTDKREARMLGYEAAQCLEEALKFYTPDSDLPPEEGLFSPASRQVLRDHPEQFTRERLVGLRYRLPALRHMEGQIRGDDRVGRPPKWWEFWKRRNG